VTVFSKTYRTWICSWCRRHLEDGDKIYYTISLQGLHFCEDCKHLIENPPDFLPEGTKEKGTTSWKTARLLTLYRDDCHCRVCHEPYARKNPVEVHHIIPKKDGGTHNLKNLITLCEKHHKETFANNYAGLKLIDRLVMLGIQKQLFA
jgi:hypothetical protein